MNVVANEGVRYLNLKSSVKRMTTTWNYSRQHVNGSYLLNLEPTDTQL